MSLPNRRTSETLNKRIANVDHTWGSTRTTNKQAKHQQQKYLRRKQTKQQQQKYKHRKEQVWLQYGTAKRREKCAKDSG